MIAQFYMLNGEDKVYGAELLVDVIAVPDGKREICSKLFYHYYT